MSGKLTCRWQLLQEIVKCSVEDLMVLDVEGVATSNDLKMSKMLNVAKYSLRELHEVPVSFTNKVQYRSLKFKYINNTKKAPET